MTLLARLFGGNRHSLTRLHLAAAARRHGYSIGEYSYGRPILRFAGPGTGLTIGRYCSIADGVEIFLAGNHRLDWIATYPFSDFADLWPQAKGHPSTHASAGPVTIGNDVWIGSGATILSGVTIGDGAVIGARAVVARDVPAYGVVVGNPGRVVRRRFDEATIAALLDLRWWDLPQDRVAGIARLLQSDRVEDLIAALRALRA